MNVFERASKALRAAVMQWTGGYSWSLASLLGRTQFDYASQVQGNGRGNSTVEACVRWIARTFPEATLQVLQAQRDGTEIAVLDAPLLKLLRKPNAYYSGELLWRATLADWTTTGNAYWLKVRSRYREPVELWWLPQQLVQPSWPENGSAYLSKYIYNPNGAPIDYDPADIVHFRDGMDPENTRKGLSPLASLLREIFTDDEAANYTAALLRNVGVPGVIIAPDTDEVNVTPDDAKAIKAEFKQLTSGDNRGDPLVMPARVKVTSLGFNPQQMDVKALRRIPEERVSAVLGVPAIVAGLGAGLDRSTFANMGEAREMAYESNIIPNQRLFAADLTSQLLGEWDATGTQRAAWDYKAVRVLQEDQNKLWVRVDTAVRGGWLTVARAQEMVGEKPEDADRVYLRSSSSEEVKPGEIREPAPVPAALAAANGQAEEDSPDDSPDEISPDDEPKGLRQVETKRRGSQTQRTLMGRLERDRVRLTAKLAGDLSDAFEALAADVRITVDGEAKSSQRIILDGGEIVQVEIPEEIDSTFRELYKAAFELIMETTGATIAETLSLPIGVMLDDPVARDMIRNWATRKGLADINEQTRKAIMDALADGREAGDGADALARRIRGYVEGRDMYPGVYQDAFDRAKARGWGDAAAEKAGDRAARQYRSETIARTETKIAQNKSSILSYRNNPLVKGLLCFDGDDCGWTAHDDAEKADGKQVTFDEADAYPLAHPRCVRSFAPIVEEP
jgi:HK97 family phage portal protein